MNVQTTEDWWELAVRTIPRLPGYADEHRCEWDSTKAETALKSKDHATLHNMFEKLWADLPDSKSIHHGAFFDLCDLCSEYWAIVGE